MTPDQIADEAFAEFLRRNPPPVLPEFESDLMRTDLLDRLKWMRDAAVRERAESSPAPPSEGPRPPEERVKGGDAP